LIIKIVSIQVSRLADKGEEIRRSLSEILLSAMNILLLKYKRIQGEAKELIRNIIASF